MAIIKIANAKQGKTYALKAVLDYIANPEKTEGGFLVSAKDCLKETAFEQMMLTKLNFSQTKGRQYIHIIQSFPAGEEVTPELAHRIGKELLDSFAGFQGVVATHTDRKHIHNHIVLNSVHMQTGRKWQMRKEQLYALRDKSDSLCRENGLSTLQKVQGWRSYGEYKGDSWKRQLAIAVAKCVAVSLNREEFIHFLLKQGIETEFKQDHIRFTLPDGKQCTNLKLMNYGDFSKSNLEQYLRYNEYAFMRYRKDRNVIRQAFMEIASMFPGNTPQQMERNLYAGKLPKLEGQALMDWIIKKKCSSSMVFEAQPQPVEERQRGLLETMDTLLENVARTNVDVKRPRPLRCSQDEELEI